MSVHQDFHPLMGCLSRLGCGGVLLLAALLACLLSCGQDAARLATEPEEYLYSLSVRTDTPGAFYEGWYCVVEWWDAGRLTADYTIALPRDFVPTVFTLAASPYATTYAKVYARTGAVLWSGTLVWDWKTYLLSAEIVVPFNPALAVSEHGYRKENELCPQP